MKITDLKRVNKLKSEYDLLDDIVSSHRISSIAVNPSSAGYYSTQAMVLYKTSFWRKNNS